MIEWVVGLAAPAAVGLAALPLLRRSIRIWRDAARDLDFHYRPGLLFTNGTISCKRERYLLSASLDTRDSSKTRIRITGIAETWTELEITARSFFGARDAIETGDVYFDQRAQTRGVPEVVFAALTPLVRRRLGWLLEDGNCEVSAGTMTVTRPQPKSSEQLVEWIESAIDLFERMSFDFAVDRLLENLETESNGPMREQLLRLLLRHPDDVRARAIELCVHDKVPAVRLLAAKSLRAAGWEPTLSLYQDTSISSEYRAQALRHLALNFGRDRTLELVLEALSLPNLDIQLTAIEAVAGWRHAGAVSQLLELSQSPFEEVRAAVAKALGRVGGEMAEQCLLGLLADSDRDVRLASIDAAGRCGSLDMISVLSQVRESALRRPARDAIAAIQARCGRRHQGALSISDSGVPDGAVSFSELGGAVSIDDG